MTEIVDREPNEMADPFSFNTGAAEVGGGDALAQTMLELAEQRDDIVLVAPDIGAGPATAAFVERYPERFFDVGIAENNSVSVAAGLAASGLRPFVLGMGAFLALKCAEQIRTDIAFNHLPVMLVSAWGGVEMGYFGTSHHALEDFAVLRGIPNLVVAAAADHNAARALIRLGVERGEPMYMRAEPTGGPVVYEKPPELEFGKLRLLRDGSGVCLVGCGITVSSALQASDLLASQGVDAAVVDLTFIKPFDDEGIRALANRFPNIVVAEEHNSTAGIGSLIAESLGRAGIVAQLATLGFPDEDLAVAFPVQLFERYGVDAQSIAEQAQAMVGAK
ncbi:MAG: transketolase C-terminal domain-containing protein [Terrimesophilobacter sp.]